MLSSPRLSAEEVADRAWEAHVAGATEVCMQGGIDPELPVTGYADLVRAVNQVGVAPGDLMAILEALQQAGAIQGQLVIL